MILPRWAINAPAIGIALWIALSLGCAQVQVGNPRGVVVGIQDGDTLTVLVDQQQIRIRIAEIDAPEKAQPFGNRSRQSLAALCHQKPASVRPVARDRYGRTVAAVSCSGEDAASHQVRFGMAWVYEQYSTPSSPLYPLQDAARATRTGLWIDAAPTPPWIFRRNRR